MAEKKTFARIIAFAQDLKHSISSIVIVISVLSLTIGLMATTVLVSENYIYENIVWLEIVAEVEFVVLVLFVLFVFFVLLIKIFSSVSRILEVRSLRNQPSYIFYVYWAMLFSPHYAFVLGQLIPVYDNFYFDIRFWFLGTFCCNILLRSIPVFIGVCRMILSKGDSVSG